MRFLYPALILSLLLAACSGTKRIQVRNLDDPQFRSLSYSVPDSNYLISTEDSTFYFQNDTFKKLIGFHAQFSPNRKQFITLEAHRDSSYVHLFNRKGKRIRRIRVPGSIVDAVYSRNSKRFYVLIKSNEDLNGRLLCVNRSGLIEFNVNIGLPNTHLTTLSFEPRRKWILVGNAVQGVIIDKKGRVRNSFNTPHFCYTDAHRHKVFSILHQYSDGSMLDLYKTPGESLGLIRFMYNEEYLLPNGKDKSSKARIRCWDMDPNGMYIATLDQSPFLQVYKMSSEVFFRKRVADDVTFCFFLKWNTIMLYHAETQSWERVILPD